MTPVAHNTFNCTWTHGTRGLVLLYAIFAAASFAGLKQDRATTRAYVTRFLECSCRNRSVMTGSTASGANRRETTVAFPGTRMS